MKTSKNKDGLSGVPDKKKSENEYKYKYKVVLLDQWYTHGPAQIIIYKIYNKHARETVLNYWFKRAIAKKVTNNDTISTIKQICTLWEWYLIRMKRHKKIAPYWNVQRSAFLFCETQTGKSDRRYPGWTLESMRKKGREIDRKRINGTTEKE